MEKTNGYKTNVIKARVGMIRVYGTETGKDQEKVGRPVKSAEEGF